MGRKRSSGSLTRFWRACPQLYRIFAFKFAQNAWRFSCQRFLNYKLSVHSNPKRHSSAFLFGKVKIKHRKRGVQLLQNTILPEHLPVGKNCFWRVSGCPGEAFLIWKNKKWGYKLTLSRQTWKTTYTNIGKQIFPLFDVQLTARVSLIENTRR